MEELMDLLVKDESPTQISDAIKDILYARTAEKVSENRPGIMNTIFDSENSGVSDETEQRVDVETSEDQEV